MGSVLALSAQALILPRPATAHPYYCSWYHTLSAASACASAARSYPQLQLLISHSRATSLSESLFGGTGLRCCRTQAFPPVQQCYCVLCTAGSCQRRRPSIWQYDRWSRLMRTSGKLSALLWLLETNSESSLSLTWATGSKVLWLPQTNGTGIGIRWPLTKTVEFC